MSDLRENLKHALLALFVILIVIDILDVLTTITGLAMMGVGEANPIAVYLIAQMGLLPGLLLIKGVSVVIIGLVIYIVVDQTPGVIVDDEAALGALTFIVLLGVLVLSNNFSIIGWASSGFKI